MFDNRKVDISWIALLGILYLLLPNIFWLLGWVRWYYALPVSAFLICGFLQIYKNVKKSYVILNKKILFNIIVIVIAAAICTESLGLHGHTLQGWDFKYRNPIYETLVRCDYPLYTRENDYFLYYYAYWICPALISKLTIGYISFLDILWLWNFTGISLACTILLMRFKERVWIVLLLLITMGSLNDFVNFLCSQISGYSSHFCDLTSYIQGSVFFSYVSNWIALSANTPHLVLPVFFVVALFYSRTISERYFPYIAALSVFWSPLTSIAILIFLLLIIWGREKNISDYVNLCRNNIPLYSAIILLLFVVAYLNNAHVKSLHTVWHDSEYYGNMINDFHVRNFKFIFNILIILCPTLIFLWRYRKTAAFKTVCATSIVAPMIWIGRNFNELTFKSSIVIFTLLSILYCFELTHAKPIKRNLIIVFLFLSSFAFQWDIAARVVHHYSWDEEKMKSNIRDDWNGHLNNEQDFSYKHFFGNQASSIFFYNEPGESARHVLKIFATGNNADDTQPKRIK